MLNTFIRDFPGVIRIEPSSLCNLRCIHCPTGTTQSSQSVSRGLMDSSTFDIIMQNICDNIHEIRVVVLYHGGEPLINRDFPAMIKKIKDLGISYVKTVSNGILLKDELIKEICESGLDAMEFSLDGISFKQNDVIRRGCNGKLVVEKIKEFIDFKKKNAFVKPQIFISTTQFLKSTENFNIDSQVPKYLLDAFSNEIRNNDLTFKTTLAMRWPDMNVDEKIFSVSHDVNGSQIQNYCDHINDTVTIRWNGDIVPCCYDLTSKIILGNIHENNLITIWNNEKYLRLRKSIQEKKFYPMCDECNTVKQHRYLVMKEDFSSS